MIRMKGMTAVVFTDKPAARFCSELCAEIREKILSSSENRTVFLADKVSGSGHDVGCSAC